MSYRKFTDSNGNAWEVRDRSASEWDFEPVSGNRERVRSVPAPGYEKDPFELSIEELQRMFDSVQPANLKPKQSPFKD
jgi:hypothetical protein